MLRISSRTKVIALFGYPLDYALSPAVLNAAFAETDLNYTCVPFEVRKGKLQEALQAMRALEMTGANIAMPYKGEVLSYLDALGPTAELVCDVDTISVEAGKLVGHNSDYHAFLHALEEGTEKSPKGKTALVLGAGGMACAISNALVKEGLSDLRIANRAQARAEALASRIRNNFPEAKVSVLSWDRAAAAPCLRECDLLVNATPGDPQTSKGPLILEKDLHPELTVFDANYLSATPLILHARRSGCSTGTGVRLLLWHAMLSFKLWTGLEPPRSKMEETLRSILGVPAAALA